MSDDINLARRGFLASGLLAASAWRHVSASAGSGLAGAATTPLLELAYGQVKFAAGPVDRQARENHRLLLGLDEDALLRPFRVRAGQRAPGHDLGGWYDTYAFAPGTTFGQWMSALSRHYAITEDAPTRAKVQRLVRAYAATVDAEGKFYRNNRFPAYTYDKLVGGLLDAQRLCHDDAAPATLAHTTQAAVPFLPPRAVPRNEHAQPGEDFSQHAWDESYTLPENQFQAWRSTGERRHLELARRFLYDEFFAALARGENVLPGKHAYSHVNGLSSAAQAYLSLGTPYIWRRPSTASIWSRRRASPPVAGARTSILSFPAAARSAPAWPTCTRVSKRPAAPTRTSSLPATCCALPASPATATAWNACYITRCSAQRRFSWTGVPSTILTTRAEPKRAFTPTIGHVAPARCP